MSNQVIDERAKLLELIAEQLDISESSYEKAVGRYKSIGRWLERKESRVAEFKPEIFPQGSMLLGTVTKQVNGEESYDLDSVCKLSIAVNQMTQEQLKTIIGLELADYATANNMTSEPEEKQRCWQLNYADSANFHIDVLPAIPGTESRRKYLLDENVDPAWVETAILITDNRHESYRKIDDNWPHSNPKGFAGWFFKRMEKQFEERQKVLAEKLGLKVEEVPRWRVKTPLQQAIQILKRHRDIMFLDDSENQPISIIITTLAAKAYDGEGNLLAALLKIAQGMGDEIEERDGVKWVPNPVDPRENFADKWIKKPHRQEVFYKWLDQLRFDISEALDSLDLQKFAGCIGPKVGNSLAEKALSEIQGRHNSPTIASSVIINTQTPPKPWSL